MELSGYTVTCVIHILSMCIRLYLLGLYIWHYYNGYISSAIIAAQQLGLGGLC